MILNCEGDLIDLKKCRVMGIINVTPDSFYDGGQIRSDKDLLKRAEKHLEEGATFLDLGGYSSRPGAEDITEEEEMRRVVNAVAVIKRAFPKAHLSVDTFRAEIAEEAVRAGASIINDISSGDLDDDMFETVAQLGVPYIAMHMRGTPQTMQWLTQYRNLIQTINAYFSERVNRLNALGVRDIILDPGFGFAKDTLQNYLLLQRLPLLHFGELPIAVGISRKSMVYELLKTEPREALNGSTALHVLALQQGASLLRVHDVKEAVQAIQIYNAFKDPEDLIVYPSSRPSSR